MEATITAKGQVTLPKALRDELSLKPGDKLRFFISEEGYIQAMSVKEPARKLKGFLPPSPVKNVTLEDMEEAIAKGAAESDCR